MSLGGSIQKPFIGFGNLLNGIIMENPVSSNALAGLQGYSSMDEVPEEKKDLGQTGSYANTVPIGGLYKAGQLYQGYGGGSFGGGGATSAAQAGQGGGGQSSFINGLNGHSYYGGQGGY